MKLSASTLEYLKNFATINSGIVVKQGNKLTTISNARNVVGLANVPDDFPRDFAIYDLPEFLNVLSMFPENPELEFLDKFVELRAGKQKAIYYYSNPEFIRVPKSDTLPPFVNEETPAIEFTLTKDVFERIRKASSILRLEQLGISADGIRAFIPDKPSSNEVEFEVEVQSTMDKEHRLKIEFLKMIPDTYHVKVFDGKIAVFTRENGEVDYVVTVEND